MDWFKSIKWFYDEKLWNKAQVWDAVNKTKITKEQYAEIIGETYPVERPVVAS